MPNRKMPVDERLMDNDCEYILELRTERDFAPVGYDGKAPRNRVQKYRRIMAVLIEISNVSCL